MNKLTKVLAACYGEVAGARLFSTLNKLSGSFEPKEASSDETWHREAILYVTYPDSFESPDGNGDFFYIRGLYYSPSVANFGLAIESSRLWKTDDLGKNWTYLRNCPWYQKDANGYDSSGWKKKVASLAIDPNNKDIWFVGGGTNVRGQEWLSCYQTMTEAAPHGLTADNEGKLWRTTNAGASWSLVNSGMHAKAQVGRIIVNPLI